MNDDPDLPAAERRLLSVMLGAREGGATTVRLPLRCWRVARRLVKRGLLTMHGRKAELTADGWWAAIKWRGRRPHHV
jgi:hypothetical protein